MTTKIAHAVILAAGRGQRMMPLTQAVPKPMAPYLDSTLIAQSIAKVRKYIPHVHVTVGYKAAMLSTHLVEIGVDSILNTNGRSNSWWIHHTLLAHLDEPIFVLTCDNVCDLDFDLLADDYAAAGEPACMLVPVEPVAGLDGDYIFHEGRVVRELSRTKPAPTYCSGIQVINPRKVATTTRSEGDFYGVWGDLMAQEQLHVSSVVPTTWFSIDTLADLERASGLAG